jgi:50S ribosomal protein L16 3-hydroxylase
MADWQLNFNREDFLANYWQKKPLLLKNALPEFEPPLDQDELAGLSLEEEIESRIVEYRDDNWHLLHGPFEAIDFQRKTPWTLLVQAVDHYIPAVAALRKQVGFIPQWRIDDIMISYAVDGGSVGPHYDNYDVFLLQGAGQRTWKLGQRCDEHSPLIPHEDLRILENFDSEEEYTLSTGDILYVPPGVAHWGIARGECMTYSIGFRAPRIQDLLSRSVDACLEHGDREAFYRDPGRSACLRPGEISQADVASAKRQLLTALTESEDESWFGELVTEPKYPPCDFECNSADIMTEAQQPGARLALLPSSRLAWRQDSNSVTVFANGKKFTHAAEVLPLVIALCNEGALRDELLAGALLDGKCAILLRQLLECGCLELE